MEQIILSYKHLDTPTISDALDKLGIVGQCFNIRSHNPQWKIVGRAFTVKYGPVDINKGTVGDYIDDVTPGDIVVLDNQGRLDCTVWGDILTEVAKRQGIGGTVIDGVCRDTNRSFDLDYPVFSVNRYMRTGKDRVQVDAVGEPVSIANIRVRQGDLIIGDADGVVIVPKEFEKQVLATAIEIEKAENKIREATGNGMRLDEARKLFNYHNLQTKGS
jgi:4-hydroxy-4-methyl-2-oxoglutarate aldolase